ncbi:MBOAT family O-acyltransferase [Hyphomonas johnsonii]|uniref:Probable alginate O-acetylase AlgI n=1 Tax=Hyphomonas johnsonii MHS-2 TaxID=1280950 RepID=A0A059FVF8_9PROT|nr:MBOAT family O-acyltransferase [Hyphomonas johnsonii]KCZ94486.1 membrane bound O-acyl transferase MBOAT family protein [Hyphomonas johnsonii MHS-2]
MLFVELRFFVFFAVVFALTWILRNNGQRKLVLTAASYVFYGLWDWRFLGLILFITVVSYLVGGTRAWWADNEAKRRLALTAGIASSLCVLGLFKYFNFFADTFAEFASIVGLPSGHVTLNLILPVGISFYTFQAISYMVDVHRGDIGTRRSVLDVAFYIAFFPQLVAGPIVRASDFIPQMATVRRWADVPVRACLTLFLIGFIKKACLSDNIAPYVDLIFNDPSAFAADQVIAGVLLYGVQIYCDFSGYSDMAIACAGLLGYKFPPNFDSPYLSTNIQIFWRRWHISLSSWLRDYLYIPLGGNRKGEMRRDVNLMTTMVLGGLWHGASFNFVIWGFLHGLALMLERSWGKHVASRIPSLGWVGIVLATAVTYFWVNLAWIFFRATNLNEAIGIARTYLTFSSPGDGRLPISAWLLLMVLGAAHALAHHFKADTYLTRMNPNSYAIAFGALFAVALAFVPLGYRPFIYFQF